MLRKIDCTDDGLSSGMLGAHVLKAEVGQVIEGRRGAASDDGEPRPMP
jgi:hypothetical protein